MSYRIAFIVFAFFLQTTVFGQWRAPLLKTITKEKRVGKTHVHRSAEDTTWQTYLGSMAFPGKKNKFYVISEFSKTAAASTWHGHSNVYFLDSQGKIHWRIIFSFPEELPTGISGRSFRFHRDGKMVAIPFKIVGVNLFCLTDKECFEVIQE